MLPPVIFLLFTSKVISNIELRNMTDVVASGWDVSSVRFDEDMAVQVTNHTHALEVFDNWELDLREARYEIRR